MTKGDKLLSWEGDSVSDTLTDICLTPASIATKENHYTQRLLTVAACILTQHLLGRAFTLCSCRTLLTGGTVVYEGSQGFAVLPVTVEVVDGQLGHLVLYPAQQALFGGQLFGLLIVLVVPHGHGDRVMEDESPDKAQDQL